MDCVYACLSEALQIAGRNYTVEELMKILIRDQSFWGSEGGVTFSGGEPLFQAEFLAAVLEECRSKYIHTTVETSAHTKSDVLLEIQKQTDWMFIDVKHMDSEAHSAETGVGNELILRNIEMAASAQWDGRLIIRVPIVPGYNDTVENLQATAAFMVKLNLQEVNLLPFHRLGHSKYDQLNLSYKFAQVSPPSNEVMQSHQRIFEDAGLKCYIDSETPF
jgi:pyruvate formate lyase activating enzyme